MTRLSLRSLTRAAPGVRRPAYDPARLTCGIVHLGVGAFHKAHQAAFTEDAIEAAGGDWGVLGMSFRRPDAADALNPQSGLYTLELRAAEPRHRIIGALRRVIVAATAPDAVLAALASMQTHVVTLTVTEPAYRLGPDGLLDLADPEIAGDLAGAQPPHSVVGWLVEGLARRRAVGGGPVTVICCDNLRANGRKLEAAVQAFASRRGDALARWIAANTVFPDTMVDAITPAADAALFARVEAAVGLQDRAAVQREPFAQWVIQDRFAGPRPAWERAGVEIVADVEDHESLKLHVLNAAHSALAYLGPPRGHVFVRDAIADPDLVGFLDALMAHEVAPALPGRDVATYWRTVKARFAEPRIDHRLDQIARDGAAKLRERVHPLILANIQAGRPAARLGRIVAAWLAVERRPPASALDDPALFAQPFRSDAAVRAAVLEAA